MIYLIGTIVIIIGFLMLWKSEWIYQNFGSVDWAETHLTGGTRLFWKLVGIALIVLSFLMMGGVVQSILIRLFVR
ncbi:MAG: hypothetical protein Q7S96_00545 [bacterium]|nr:hypothetical protein [bacterium]